MGWHWFKDLTAPNGTLSWQATALMPVVPMYDPVQGNINAIFFASAKVQQDGWPMYASNNWEPVKLSDSLMCGNLCDSDCTFAGTDYWSTMHFYFNDHSKPELTCSKSSEISHCFTGVSCCPN